MRTNGPNGTEVRGGGHTKSNIRINQTDFIETRAATEDYHTI